MTTILDGIVDEQKPSRQNLFDCLRTNLHLKCLVLTFLISSGLVTILWCKIGQITHLILNIQSLQINGQRKRTSPCDDGYIYIPMVFVVMLYFAYLIECWHSSTRSQLVYSVDAKTVDNYIQQMKESQPIIWWKAVCYHYIRRSRTLTRYRNGEASTTTQIYYERINTHIAGSCFSYVECGYKDVSKILIDLDKHPSTRIKFTKGFAFATIEAANEFESQRNRFFHECERHDDYLEMREGLDLIGTSFQEYMISSADQSLVPWYFSHLAFWLFSFALLSWPIRIAIELKTSHVNYQVTKLFGVNQLNSQSGYNRIGNLGSIDSFELVNNCTLAPSYSEALLICNVNNNNTTNINNQPGNLVATTTNQTTTGTTIEDQPKVSGDTTSIQMSQSNNIIVQSCSRTSLINGQFVYLPRPLGHGQANIVHLDDPSSANCLISTSSSLYCETSSNDSNNNHDNHDNDNTHSYNYLINPPTYQEAITECRPLLLTTTIRPLHRSITVDRDFFHRLSNQIRQPCRSLTNFIGFINNNNNNQRSTISVNNLTLNEQVTLVDL
ncbi:transmembrane protein 151B-like [Panonychus citri]|uniref:transmembrane protein 151B-like n=1 Tax=Panonychus citri TaxID=50023 RepID=UPI002307474E|nr:transmembrane protein 151B-like [Panonychus citri]